MTSSKRSSQRGVCEPRGAFSSAWEKSTAAILCRILYNPELVVVYESGTVGAKPFRVPLSIGDGELAATADFVVSVPEMFNYWIQQGRIEVAFLRAAQIDRHGNLNLSRRTIGAHSCRTLTS